MSGAGSGQKVLRSTCASAAAGTIIIAAPTAAIAINPVRAFPLRSLDFKLSALSLSRSLPDSDGGASYQSAISAGCGDGIAAHVRQRLVVGKRLEDAGRRRGLLGRGAQPSHTSYPV